MERVQPLSKEKSPVALLSGDAEGKGARISSPSVLEAKLSDDNHRGSAPAIDPLSSLEKALQKKLETPKRDFKNTLATQDYGCKYCDKKFGTLQSLGGHQNAHKRERATKKLARVMKRIGKAFSNVDLNLNPNYFDMQAIPLWRHPVAYGPPTRPLPTDVIEPAYGGTPKPTTITNPQASTSDRSAMVNQPYGTVYLPMSNGDPNFCTGVPPQSTGPIPPLANVHANGSSFNTQEGLEDGGLDLSLRL